MKQTSRSSKDSHLTGIITGTIIVLTLYFAKVVFIPLALALLLSFILTPIVMLLERIRIKRAIAIFIVMTCLVGLMGILGWKMYGQLTDLAEQLPTYKMALVQKIQSLKGHDTQALAKMSSTIKDLENEISKPAVNSLPTGKGKQPEPPGASRSNPMPVEILPPSNPVDTFESMLGPLATAGIILVFTIFMLLDREELRNRFIRLAGGSRLSAMTQALEEANQRINRYLLLQTAVNGSYGIIIGIALHFIGIPNASLWGVAATILRFIPYAGPPLAGSMPILLSLAIFPGWTHAMETLGLFVALEIVVSNFIEPLLYGSNVGMTALAILVAAIFWTLIWGLPGLMLSTPLTAFLVVMGRYVPGLSNLSVLLGDEPVLPLSMQYYQRLLAVDQDEAKLLLERQLKEKPLAEIYETIVIPALSHAEHDTYKNEIDEHSETLMFQEVREMIEDLGEAPIERAEPESQKAGEDQNAVSWSEGENGQPEIVCVPSRDEADDLIALMLSQLLSSRGYKSQNISLAPVSEMLSEVGEMKPKLICIASLPPFAMSHARELYRRLRAQLPHARIVICMWHFEGDLPKTSARMKMIRGDSLFVSVPQLMEYADRELGTKVQLDAVS
ncbi:MAG TPA: AI-2E family transporter [Candidatus Acidoferrales bacterium]|nr:AI-2E family transporter [Candidatus Acidoferrales bacterium]